MKSAYSNAYPHVPEHVSVGFVSDSPASVMERSGTTGMLSGAPQPSPDQRHRRLHQLNAAADGGLSGVVEAFALGGVADVDEIHADVVRGAADGRHCKLC